MKKKKSRILVVDDDHDCRLLLSSLMAKAGYEVDAVADGEMALATVISNKPDVVLLDACLPVSDGFEVCARIKENESTANIGVLMLTAFATPSHREKGLKVGVDEYVEKPFRNESIIEIVQHLLAIKRASEQLDPGAKAVAEGLRQPNVKRGRVS